jgi:hypothetical protein
MVNTKDVLHSMFKAASLRQAIKSPDLSSPGNIFDAMITEVTMLDTGSPARTASEEARAVATKYGLEFLPS